MSPSPPSRLTHLRRGRWIAAGLLLVFIGQGLAAVLANSQTFDEPAHFAAGYSYWATGDFRLNAEDPPLVKQLCVLPVWLLFDLPLETGTGSWLEADQFRIGFELLYGESKGGAGLFARGAETGSGFFFGGASESRSSKPVSAAKKESRPLDADVLLHLARLPNLLLGACLVALVGWWSYRLWGPAAGLLAMAL